MRSTFFSSFPSRFSTPPILFSTRPILFSDALAVLAGQVLLLVGDAFDIDTGTLKDVSVATCSCGSSCKLPEDEYVITFIADDDGEGPATPDQVLVNVVGIYKCTPEPDALRVEPCLISLEPAAGKASETVSIGNWNCNHPMSWEAEATERWVQLSASSGSTSAEIAVGLDQAALGVGTHAATVTYSSSATPGQSLRCTVEATITCVADCSGDKAVTVDEILTMVNIALGNAPLLDCEAADSNHDGQVTIDEILKAVNSALNGCG